MGNRMTNIATPMPQPRAKFTNKLGLPLSGGKVYTYEPGTNIPKKTWRDVDKSVENTNPIQLDAAGEADIFLDGLYQIVVKDRFGFTVYNVEKTGVIAEWEAYVAQPFKPGKTYLLNERVMLENGDIVKSTVANNLINPNADMSGWELVKDVINVSDISALVSLPNGRVSNRHKYHVWGYGGGEFAYTSSNISAKVKADPGMGLYIPYPSGSNGSQGGFVRNYDGGSLKGQWFGIKSQAGYDNYQAIRNAVIAAVCLIPNRSDENPTIKLPAGKIEVHQNNVLGNIDFASYGLGFTFASGVRFQGQGITSTRFVIVPNGQPKWVYDSLTSTNQRVLDMHFLDMSIRAETEAEMELVDLFRIYSTGVDKRFRFWRCMLRGGHIFSLHGNGNADLHRLEGCSVAAYRSFLNLNNRQAVAIETHSTDILVYRDFVVIGEEGGGSFKQFGGNLEMHAHPTDTSDHFLFKDTGNTGARMGLGNCDFLSQGVRYEIHGANKKIFYANRTSVDRPIIYTIDNGQFGTVTGGTRQAVYAKGLNIVIKFKDTILNDNLTFYAESAASMSGGANAPVGVDIRFKDCCSGNSAKLAPRCTYTGDKVRFSSIGTYQLPSATSSRPVLDDFEFGWTTGACNRAVLVKTVNLTNGAANTLSASTTKNFTFPAGAYIKRLSIKSAASGSSTVPYKICVGHLASNTIIASSTGATVADAHNILVEDVGPFNYDLLSVWAETESGSKLFTGTLDYI